MRRLVGIAAVALFATACSSGQPTSTAQPTATPIRASATATASASATPPQPTPAVTPSAPRTPLGTESCGAGQKAADGNFQPILCPDGHPSQAADSYFRALRPTVTVLNLHVGASLNEVEGAMCADKRVSHMTNPMEESAYNIRAAELGWNYGAEPVNWLIEQPC